MSVSEVPPTVDVDDNMTSSVVKFIQTDSKSIAQSILGKKLVKVPERLRRMSSIR